MILISGKDSIVSAANAPGVRAAILVTPRADGDVELRAVRRSGIPSTIVRPMPIFERVAGTEERVLVARELAAPASAVTVDLVVESVIDTLDVATSNGASAPV